MKERIQRFFQSEREKTAHMEPKARASYIWDYYRIPIVGIFCFVLLTVYLVSHFAAGVREYWVYIMFADTRAEAGEGSALWEGYVAYTGFDIREKNVTFNSEAWFNYARDEGRGNRYYALFCGLTDAGVLDAVTMDPASLEALGRSGRLMDLRDERCAVLYERCGDRLIYAVPYDEEYSTEPVPVGIDISDSSLVTQFGFYEDGCAIGIGANSGRTEAVVQFLEYLYGAAGQES